LRWRKGVSLAGIYNQAINNAYDANGNILKLLQWGWKLTGSEQIDGLTYNYQTSSNKLLKVTDSFSDPVTKLGDFKDGSNGSSDDYSYDANGNLIADQNKKILNIQYNHLNLPQLISIEPPANWQNGLRTITYTYDANGNKLQKKVNEVMGTNSNRTITHTYINGFIYETKVTNQGGSPEADDHSDLLQFIPHEEGWIRFKPAVGNIAASFQYDYMLKDHLGNVRMVLTEEQQQDRYPAASLEDDTYQGGIAVNIEGQYYNIVSTKIVPATSVTGLPTYQNNNGVTNNNPYSNTSADSKKLYKLDASNNNLQDKNGLGIVLKVMAGDAINIWGKSYHKMPSSGYNSATNPLSVVDLMNLLATSQSASGKGITGTQISGLPGFPTNVTDLLNNQPPQNSNRPRASINWIILDEQFKYVSGGFDMVGTATNSSGTFKDHSIQGIAIPKNGYIYVYCSNESQYPVYFDNIQVVHDRGPILEEKHYYPFGLTMSGISSKAAGNLVKKKGFNNGAEFEGMEFLDESGLNLYSTNFRMLDPQLGRWNQIDPRPNFTLSLYSSMDNNPISYNDPLGDTSINGVLYEGKNSKSAMTLKEVTLFSNKNSIPSGGVTMFRNLGSISQSGKPKANAYEAISSFLDKISITTGIEAKKGIGGEVKLGNDFSLKAKVYLVKFDAKYEATSQTVSTDLGFVGIDLGGKLKGVGEGDLKFDLLGVGSKYQDPFYVKLLDAGYSIKSKDGIGQKSKFTGLSYSAYGNKLKVFSGSTKSVVEQKIESNNTSHGNFSILGYYINIEYDPNK